MNPRRYILTVGLSISVIASGCTSAKPPTPAVSSAGPGGVYVALGNGETAGNGVKNRIRDAWPQVLYRAEFSRSTVFANFGQSDISVEQALTSQLEPALALAPTVATVHLTEDTFLTRDPKTFGAKLATLVRRLQRNGRTAVVIGNIAPSDRQPGILACLPNPPANGIRCRIGAISDLSDQTARDNAFNTEIAEVAKDTGARLVDLHAAFLTVRGRGKEDAFWVGNDFSPNEAGHRFIARQFAPAIRAALKSRE